MAMETSDRGAVAVAIAILLNN